MEHSSVDNSVYQCKTEFPSACYGAAKYKHGDERYCILHLPSENKKDDFNKAVQSRLKRNDFCFAGVYFPSGFGDFSGATFSGRADFSGATFSEKANFFRATFSGEVYFSYATFVDAYFSATFSGRADFEEATFSGWAYFYKTTFSEKADFSLTTFSENADFSFTTFSEVADFSGATFKESAGFYYLEAFPRTMLVFGATVIEKPERISFNRTYLRPSWFVDVDAQKFDFGDVKWFRIPDASAPNPDQLKTLTLEKEIENLVVVVDEEPEDKSSWPQGSRTENLRKLTKACRRLMNNAEENRDYPTANEMHYWSMEAMRKEGWSRLGLIATLYWALSGYGERPRRAFFVLGRV